MPSPPGTDYFTGLARLKAQTPPLFWTRRNGGHWVVTDTALAREVLSDSERFSSHALVVAAIQQPARPRLRPHPPRSARTHQIP